MDLPRPNDKILSYNDVVLRGSDLDILKGPHFINDPIIEFYFNYLSSSKFPSHDVLFVPPSISFWISNYSFAEDLKEFVVPLKLQDRKLILFPVNNNEDMTAEEGGSHWSLLAYYQESFLFEYYDSLGGLNKQHALKLCRIVKQLVGAPKSSNILFSECDTPQQKNGYDCGLYMLAIAEVLCGSHQRNPDDLDGPHRWRHQAVKLLKVGGLRSRILQLIEDMMKCERRGTVVVFDNSVSDVL